MWGEWPGLEVGQGNVLDGLGLDAVPGLGAEAKDCQAGLEHGLTGLQAGQGKSGGGVGGGHERWLSNNNFNLQGVYRACQYTPGKLVAQLVAQ